MAESTVIPGDFPVSGLLPKKETGILSHLSKYPEYDGRGTVVAIFDSGVDPAAPGLATTTDGKVKVLDRYDASGCGDVDMTTIVKPVDGIITGLTGRRMKIPDSFQSPSGEYRIGVKDAYTLYPSALKDRIYDYRKELYFSRHHKLKVAASRNALLRYDGKNAKPISERYPNEGTKEESPGQETKDNESTASSLISKCEKEDLDARVSLLSSLEKKYKDPGPIYDIVMFLDEKDVWRVCIDVYECGDLKSGVFLGEYIKTHEHAYLTEIDMFTVSVNVYERGDVLEICGMSTAHGTHVASITAAHFPDCPEKNGVAPGAQIVSITIGDSRLGSMETSAALVRAMTRVMDNPYYKVDVINMSYGEHSQSHSTGRFVQLAHEVVNDFGIIWVASASNSGPALSTIGTPPSMKTESIIGVGAYVTPDMMTAEYSMTEKLPLSPYTWSSRGPTADGCRGVTICAPGGAITSVPSYTLRSCQLMNGTSMSAPHTSGAVALLVSGCKQKEIKVTPYLVRRALENTALALGGDVFAQGHGLLQVDKAFEYLCQFHGGCEDKVRLQVELHGMGPGNKALYMRNWKGDSWKEFTISVEPFLLNAFEAEPEDKLAFEGEYILTCNASWVKAPSCLQMSYSLRTLKVQVDPTGLPRGQAYFTSVKAYCSKLPEKGHIFEIPITIVVPHLPSEYENGVLYNSPCHMYRPGTVRHDFFHVPKEATWAKITLKSRHPSKPIRFALHMLQLKPSCNIKSQELYKITELLPNEETSYIMSVTGGLNLEVCTARWWSSLVDGEVSYSIEFHGITVACDTISIVASDHCQRVDLMANFRSEEVHFNPVIKTSVQSVAPYDNVIEALGEDRDVIPRSRPVYQLDLSYSFSVPKDSLEITPRIVLSDVLYESPFDSQFFTIYNSNKCVIAHGDAYSEKYSTKLEKGDYVIKYFIRHERCDLLEKLTNIPVTITIKLPNEIKLDTYTQLNEAITCGKKTTNATLRKDVLTPLYISSPSFNDKNPKLLPNSSGDILMGTISLSKDDQVKKAVMYPLRILMSDPSSKKKSPSSLEDKKKNSNNSNSEDKKEAKSYSDYLESLRDFQTNWIAKLDKSSATKLFGEIEEASETHIAAYVAQLAHIPLNTEEGRERASTLIKTILSSTNMSSYLEYAGQRTDLRKDCPKIKTQMEKQKSWLVETYAAQGLVLLNALKELPAEERLRSKEVELDRTIVDLLKIVDQTDSKVYDLMTEYYHFREFYGLETKLCLKHFKEHKTKENFLKVIDCYSNLEFYHSVQLLQLSVPLLFPKNYQRY